MKILTETISPSEAKNLIKESVNDNGDKSYFIEGIFMQAEVVNGNNRIYPNKVLSEAVKVMNKDIIANKLVGELNHPSENSSMINPDRACIKITEFRQEGNNIYGKAKVMKSLPCGAIVHGLLSEGVLLGVSSRGFGEVKRNDEGIAIVQSPLVLKTVDVVTEPSAPDAYVNAIMENKEWAYENGILIEKEVKNLINKDTRKNIDVKETFTKILTTLIENKTK